MTGGVVDRANAGYEEDWMNDDEAARALYVDKTANHPTIHCNRFPAWDELTEAQKNEYRTPHHPNYSLSGLIAALRHQRQIDEDGTEVGVSRQACDEAAKILAVYEKQLPYFAQWIALGMRGIQDDHKRLLALLRLLRDEWFEPHYNGNNFGFAVILRDKIRDAINQAESAQPSPDRHASASKDDSADQMKKNQP